MKIKNLAFFGIMAAIMGVAGTARADTTTVIASQAYVDAKDDLKQNLLNSGTNGNIVESGTGNVVTGITADGRGTVTVTKGNVDVSAAVSGLDLTDAQATGTGTVVKSVTQDNGQIAVTKGTIADADVASDAAIADTKIAFSTAHTSALDSGITSTKVSGYDTTKTTVDSATGDNVVATRTANTNLLKGSGLQNAVAHLKGNGAENYTANVDNTNAENSGIKNETVSSAAKTAWDATLTAKEGDNYLTTLAAVERRVQEGVQDAVSQAGNNVSTAYADKNLSNLTDTGKANVSALGTYSSATEYTDGTVGAAIKGNAANIATNATNIATNTTNIATNTTNIGTNTTNIGTLTNLSTTAKNNLVAAINELDTDINSLDTNKQNASDSKVADGTYNYITQGNGVGANLVKLDTQAKTNADNIATNTTNIATINTTLQGKQDTLTFDDSPTANSTNPVKSGGVYTALAGKQASFNDGTQNGRGLVKEVSQNGGTVSATASLGVYVSDMNNALKGVSSNSTAACTKGSPCTLTYYKDGTNEYMRWTPMDTESTDADTTAADSSNA